MEVELRSFPFRSRYSSRSVIVRTASPPKRPLNHGSSNSTDWSRHLTGKRSSFAALSSNTKPSTHSSHRNETQSPEGASPKPAPLASRRFTLTLKRAPAASLFAKLAEQGVQLRYDADALGDAGIDLEQRISVTLENATPDEFFRAICAPLGLSFSIRDDVVTLKPAPSTPND